MKRMSKLHKKLVAQKLPRPCFSMAAIRRWSGPALSSHGPVGDVLAVSDRKLVLTTNESPRLPNIPSPAVRKRERTYIREKNWARKKRRYRRHLRYEQTVFARMFTVPWEYRFA